MTLFPDIAFINEEATGCINEEAIGAINEATISAIIAPRNQPSCFLISCCTFSAAPSVNRLEVSNDFAILIISSITSSKINKVNTFPVLTAPRPLSLPSNLSNIDAVSLNANLGKTSLEQQTARSISVFLPKLPIILPRNAPDWII